MTNKKFKESRKISPEEEKYNLWDNMLEALLVNIYSLSKEEKRININGYVHKAPHILFLSICNVCYTMYNYPIYIHMNWFKFIWYKIRYWRTLAIHYSFTSKGMDIDKELTHISNAFEVSNAKTLFYDIYYDYFMKGKK